VAHFDFSAMEAGIADEMCAMLPAQISTTEWIDKGFIPENLGEKVS
jgi:hypothetical protein